MPRFLSHYCWLLRLFLFLMPLHFAKSFAIASSAAAVLLPATFTIGALLDGNSTIGKVAQQAIELAIIHINRDHTLLNASKLALQVVDTGSTAFLGAAAAVQLLEREVIAIAGPQSSAVAMFVAHIGTATQIPLVSFAASDPALSRYQYPYFFRTVPSDAVQMAAVAGVVNYFGWKEVAALYTDDDYGLDGISALSDSLRDVGARLVYKAALDAGSNKSGIALVLTQLAAMESQVFVVHTSQDIGLLLFAEAYRMGMMSLGYAWIVTDSILATLDTVGLTSNALASIQGIIGTRSYIPNSPRLQNFLTDWKDSQSQQTNHSQLNVYGMYAYDSVWMIAYAIDSFLKQGRSFNFDLLNEAVGNTELAQVKMLREGPLLRQQILQTKFNGTTGPIEMDMKGDNLGSGFEIVNLVGSTFNVIGYWTNESGVSASPSDTQNAQVHSVKTVSQDYLRDAIWPGNSIDVPHAGLIRKDDRLFRIAVPQKTGYEQFVGFSNSSSNTSKFYGFCIDVFEDVLKYLPYSIHYEFILYGNERSSSRYDEMIVQLANKVYDAVVGDVTITAKRMELVDFTQPFTESGLVIVVPQSSDNFKKGWDFLQPFTLGMWLTTGGFFIFIGIVIWVLERRNNPDFKGHPRKQIETALWFTFSTLYYTQKEDTRTTLGRCVVLVWLFFILIVTSSYTANLTSMLTVQQLSPTLQSLKNLQESNLPIGYQDGSFVRDYLISLNIHPARLKPLNTLEDYASALKLGPEKNGVAAIVDELPYIQVFLASECGFAISGQPFTKEGWGFAFRKDLQLATDFSAAILTVSENGDLQRIHDFWLNKHVCDSAASSGMQSDQLDFGSFWVLFLIFGMVSVSSLIIYNVRRLYQSPQRAEAFSFSKGERLRDKWMDKKVAPKLDERAGICPSHGNLSEITLPPWASNMLKGKEEPVEDPNDNSLSHNHISKKMLTADKLVQCSSSHNLPQNSCSNSEQTLSDLIQHHTIASF